MSLDVQGYRSALCPWWNLEEEGPSYTWGALCNQPKNNPLVAIWGKNWREQ